MPHARLASRTLLVAAACLLAACDSGVSVGRAGPMHDTSNASTFCISSEPGRAVAVGWDLLQVSGTQSARIESVTLAGARGLSISGAQVVPVAGQYIVGNGWAYPITPAEVRELPKQVDWQEAQPATGAVVRPSSTPEVNLVAGVVATGAAGGSATGIVLTYVVGGSTYQLTTGSGVTVRVAPQQC